MPLSAIPSDRSNLQWASLAHVPFRIDVIIIIVAFFTLLFSLSSAAYGIGRDTGYNRRDQPTTDEIAANIALGIVPPLSSMILSVISISLHSYSVLAPGLAVAISVVMFAGWGGGVLIWWVLVALIDADYGDHDGIHAVHSIQVIGAVVEVILYITYLVYSAKAVHRLRRRRRLGEPVFKQPDVELQSTTQLHVGAEPK